MIRWRNLGCKLASFLRRLAIGLQAVFKAKVPSLKRGNTIVEEWEENACRRRRKFTPCLNNQARICCTIAGDGKSRRGNQKWGLGKGVATRNWWANSRKWPTIGKLYASLNMGRTKKFNFIFLIYYFKIISNYSNRLNIHKS